MHLYSHHKIHTLKHAETLKLGVQPADVIHHNMWFLVQGERKNSETIIESLQ